MVREGLLEKVAFELRERVMRPGGRALQAAGAIGEGGRKTLAWFVSGAARRLVCSGGQKDRRAGKVQVSETPWGQTKQGEEQRVRGSGVWLFIKEIENSERGPVDK